MTACANRTHGKAFIFLPGYRHGPLARVYEPIVVCLVEWLQHRGIEHDVIDRAKKQRHADFCSIDVAILVGPDTYSPKHDRYPLARLSANHTNLVVYNTEPLSTQRCTSASWHFLRKASSAARNQLEIWDYSNANLHALRSNATRCIKKGPLAAPNVDANVPLRFVPPGWHRSLGYRARIQGRSGILPARDTRLFFLGEMRYRSRKCWAVLNRSNWLSEEFVSSGSTWGANAYREVFERHTVFANLHRSCGNPQSPLETFRLSLLLNNGATVLSELSDPDDMVAYRGLVHFCEYASLPRCHAQLRAEGVQPWEQVQRQFADSFSVGTTFARARVATGVIAPLLPEAAPSSNVALLW